MTRSACAALLLAAACAGNPAHPTGNPRAEEPGAPPPPVAYGGEVLRLGPDDQGYKRPRLADDGCLAVALSRASGAAGVENKVRFAVLRDGSLARFSYLEPITEAQRRAVEEAFASCEWAPGLDPSGRPVAVWVIQPIKVVAAPPSPYR
jgi:hypothetical protein